MLGKVLTAKAAALAGVLVLSGGVASAAATGTLPDPVQDSASHAVEHVGLHIPKSDKHAEKAKDDKAATDDNGADASTEVEHPENHGKDVSTVAHDDSTEGADHGAAVCAVASEGKCKPNATEDNSGPGKSGDHRQDDEHVTTSTTAEVTDGSDSDSSDDNSGASSEDSGKPEDSGHHGHGNGGHGSDD